MQNINHVIVSGNVTRDPELKATPSGTSLMSVGIAVNEQHRNKQTGIWEDYANFFDVALYGTRADSLAKIVKKGMRITVSGHLRYRSWEKDGQKRSRVDIVADEIELPPKPKQEPQPAYQQAPQPAYQPQQAYTQQQLENPATWQQQPPYDQYYGDDDIPF